MLALDLPQPRSRLQHFLGVARSARGFAWRERLAPERAGVAAAICQRLGAHELIGRILAARGVSPDAAADVINPTLKRLMPDPLSLLDMGKAADRLAMAVAQAEPIAVFGDYDVDGAASAALMARFLAAHGRLARLYIPDRMTEGYGPNAAAIDRLIDEGARLIVTVDCGATSHEALAAAAARRVDVVVVDHHQMDERLPPACAVVNPNRLDDLSGQGHLSAAGVVFLLLAATVARLRAEGFYGSGGEPQLLAWLDLVALSTICDVVPLVGVNRAFVAQGLKVMRRRENAGLRALADAAGLKSPPTPYHLGFVLGPRINAGGRIGDSGLGARLLSADHDADAATIAATLDRLNRERQAMEARMLEDASARAAAQIEARPDAAIIVLASADYHKGVAGLLASRITEQFQRPALVIAWDGEEGGEGSGSGRSVAGVDLGQAVRSAVEAGHLRKGGGHAMAAGVTIARDRLDAFAAFLQDRLAPAAAGARSDAALEIDGALAARGATAELVEQLEQAGPYGMGFPSPRFALPMHRVAHVKPAGEAHLRCRLQGPDGSQLDAVAFRAAGTALGALLSESRSRPLHLAGRLHRDTWGGRERVELQIEDAADPSLQHG